MSDFLPRPGCQLIVSLPGETLRCVVDQIISDDVVFVKIPQPLTRNHSYRSGDLVACRRTPGLLGETWDVIEYRTPTIPPEQLAETASAPRPAEMASPQPSPRKASRHAMDRRKLREKA